jgi:glycosyltransferase involved in cell wall biosynthesis
MPFFSIVIPTRNRGHLLGYALQSALAQTFDDYEVVICDNGSTDQTASVAQASHDRRMRYVRTDRVLAMPDNWEFALTHARGEYVTYLCDDDAIHPRLLHTLHRLIQAGWPDPFTWGACRYIHPSSFLEEKRNTLIHSTYTGTEREMESHRALTILYSLRTLAYPAPKMLNACCSRRVIAEIQNEAGRFFVHKAPDYSACVAMLAFAPRYTYVDEPFWIAGESPESIGNSMEYRLNSRAGSAFLKEFGDPNTWFRCVPLEQPSEINTVAETILRVQAALPGRLGRYHLGWARYFAECYIRIQRSRHFGDDVSNHLEEFWRALARQPRATRARVRAEIAANRLLSRLRGRPVEGMRDPMDLLKRAAVAGMAAMRLPGFRRSGLHTVRGDEAGFANIAECAALLDRVTGRAPVATARASAVEPAAASGRPGWKSRGSS